MATGSATSRFAYCSFERPSSFQALEKRQIRDAANFSPFRQGPSAAVNSQASINSGVSVLLRPQRPFAIIWAIWAVIVDTFNAVKFRRTRSHISIERREIGSPLFADANASSTVVHERSTSRVVASALHFDPRIMFRRMRKSVLGAQLGCVSTPASATGRSMTSQSSCRNRNQLATITDAIPVSSFSSVQNN